MKETRILIGQPNLLSPLREVSALKDILALTLSRRGALALRIRGNSLAVESEVAENPVSGIALTGRWRSPLLRGMPRCAEALLLFPYFFRIDGIHLSHDQLFTLGRDDRALADVFMRNLFFAACRGAEFDIRSHSEPIEGLRAGVSRDLTRCYGWIMKSTLKEPMLGGPNAAELVLASAHVPLTDFDSPIVRAGVATMRRAAVLGQSRQGQIAMLRERAMSLYA
jgi:hypothetical protein